MKSTELACIFVYAVYLVSVNKYKKNI